MPKRIYLTRSNQTNKTKPTKNKGKIMKTKHNQRNQRNKVKDIRKILKKKLKNKEFVEDKSGAKMIEIIGAHFIANKDSIFGKLNEEYAKAEIQWYESQSRNVDDIAEFNNGKVPAIWDMIASKNRQIQSNYGWAVFSKENHYQYEHALQKLIDQSDTRQAILIYNRPSMQKEWNEDGMSDFMCCQNNQFVIRKNKLVMIVNFRSQDSRFGYLNDYFWMRHLQTQMLKDLEREYPNLKRGKIIWNASSLHVYEKDFYLVDHYSKTGEINITKKDYDKLYS
jgi:thymidylate synthase